MSTAAPTNRKQEKQKKEDFYIDKLEITQEGKISGKGRQYNLDYRTIKDESEAKNEEFHQKAIDY